MLLTAPGERKLPYRTTQEEAPRTKTTRVRTIGYLCRVREKKGPTFNVWHQGLWQVGELCIANQEWPTVEQTAHKGNGEIFSYDLKIGSRQHF